MTHNILHIDASARSGASISRKLSAQVLGRVTTANPDNSVVSRDLTQGFPFVSEDWIGASYTPAADRTEAQKELLGLSNALVAEIKAADTIVLGTPIYNFAAPAALKSWIDMIARVGETFQYGANGPEGLLKNKRVIVALASGGTQIGSPLDHITPYLTFIFGFMGITDVQYIGAMGLNMGADAAIAKADADIAALAA
ncbi:MAG: FMN-dependent NADH-azoreductase [Rhodobacteraceae bacterium]|nr:MAG: FMN-dependent NADH-azoreductase [Paracoccaceae bacterium]